MATARQLALFGSSRRARKAVRVGAGAFARASSSKASTPSTPSTPSGSSRRGKPGPRVRAERVGFVPHETRPHHEWRHPVHVSMRRVRLGPDLRSERVYRVILAELARAKGRGVRVVQFSVQHDHVHLMVEGHNAADLSNQMRKLFSAVAMSVNAVAKRRGSLFRDRHHRRELTTPTQTRNTLVYILFNARKHAFENGGAITERTLGEVDDRSSAAWFDGWDPNARPPPELVTRLRDRATSGTPVTAPRTWLAQTGWRRGGGPVSLHEVPRIRA